MNEGQKTGAFWGAAAIMLAIGLLVAWPTSTRDDMTVVAGQPLFEEFTDPLAASSLKIETFDEEQGQLDTFEVERDRESGEWTIPSRDNYPADAVEQMRDAANALVGLQILDVQTRNVEDHEALGVVEPALDDLEVGEVGVGRKVTFKDESQKTLASVIIGKPVKGEEGKIYVRRSGQDPVYVVKLDESALSTRFQAWIEQDLLQLSSIDIQDLSIQDYNAAMGPRGGVSLDRNYSADLTMDGSEWKLQQLLEYPSENPLADPVPVEVGADQVPNTDRLNDVKNALDDLKIVDVIRKPDGLSANLRADQELISDSKSIESLATRGFFPVSLGAEGKSEVLSANGEMSVTLNDGVQYVLRFGNVSGLSDEPEEGEEEASGTGVNRHLLVTAKVDQSQFPPPDLKPVPQTIEELEALLGGASPDESPVEMSTGDPTTTDGESQSGESQSGESESDTKSTEDEPVETDESAVEETAPSEEASPSEEGNPTEGEDPAEEVTTTDGQPTSSEETDPNDQETVDGTADSAAGDEDQSDSGDSAPASDSDGASSSAGEESAVEEIEVSGGGTETGEGQGDAEQTDSDQAGAAADESEQEQTDSPATAEQPADVDASAEQPPAPSDAKASDDGGELSFSELSAEEKQERLEAEQEKILKENTRRIDARKDELAKAERRVRELTDRFADWYYVIPESTYRDLRIGREELLISAEEAEAAGPPPQPNFGGPGFGGPGFGGPN